MKKLLRIILPVFISFCFFQQGKSQTQRDSIEVAEEVMSIFKTKSAQSKKALTETLNLIQRTRQYKNKLHLAKAFSLYAVLKDDDADYEMSVVYNDSAIYFYKQANFPLGIALCKKNKGLVLQRSGLYKEALSSYLDALKIVDSLGNTLNEARILNNLGLLYNEMGQYELSIKSYKRSLDFYKPLDSVQYARTLQNFAVPFELSNKLEEAQKIYLEAISISEAFGDSLALSIAYDNLGGLYKKTGNTEKALEYHLKGLTLNKLLNDDYETCIILNNIAEIYLEKKLAEKAKQYADEALQIATTSKILKEEGRALHSIAGYYLFKNDFKTANEYLQRELAIINPLFDEAMAKSTSEMLIKYQTEKKENENKRLEQENQINQLELTNREQKLQQRNQLIIILVISLLFVLSIVLWQLGRIRLRKQREEIERNKQIQLEKERISRDLHDSVGGQLSYILYTLEDGNKIRIPGTVGTISNTVRNVIGDLRQTIWAMSDDQLSLQSMSDKLKVYARNLFNNTDVKITFEENIPEHALKSSATILHLFRACQEIINNAFKHSRCTHLSITLAYSEKINIVITDDGIGINKDNTGNDSFGLSNIAHRIKEINGSLKLSSKPGETTFRIVV